MTDQELKDLVANLVTAQANTQAEVAETSRVIKEVGRRMGAMPSNQGDVTEEFFYNSLVAKPALGGIEFDSVTPNLRFQNKGEHDEFDIVLTNGASVALIEVKYKAHLNDLEQAQSKIASYRRWRPEHKDYKVYAGLASFSVPPDVADAAQDKGLFVLQRRGDVIEVDAQRMKAF
ncbi:MAG: hypothetical protein HC765_16085 [Brachymonas sp.]|nr:hypothetical protein [Brachymonas sp.]